MVRHQGHLQLQRNGSAAGQEGAHPPSDEHRKGGFEGFYGVGETDQRTVRSAAVDLSSADGIRTRDQDATRRIESREGDGSGGDGNSGSSGSFRFVDIQTSKR